MMFMELADVLAHPLVVSMLTVILSVILTSLVWRSRENGRKLDALDAKIDETNMALLHHMGVEETQRAGAEAREKALVASVDRVEAAVTSLSDRFNAMVDGNRR